MPELAQLFLVIGFFALCAYGLMKVSELLKPLESSNAKDEPLETLSDAVNELLPQTQCGQCGYAGCRPYAEAIAAGDAINKCPPGGKDTIADLALLLNQQTVPLDPVHGQESERKIAYIREHECIGCTKCIQACPVDAILGASKRMHTVIVSECTGCDLCVDPCPVDCIEMRAVPQTHQEWTWPKPGTPTRVIWPDQTSKIGVGAKP